MNSVDSYVLMLAVSMSYLIGSIPVGYVIARQHGVDIRTVGSGNIGATNVYRKLGRKTGALVLALDVIKGAIPVFLAKQASDSSILAISCGGAAILGHMFPVWLKFQGGKGVATAAGVVAMLLPGPVAIGLVGWLATVCASRYVSLASILGGVIVVIARLIWVPEPFAPGERILTGFALTALTLVVVRHAGNLARLVRGNEHQMAESSAMNLIGRVLHVLTLGLWFGSAVFFSLIAAVLIFQTWRAYGSMSLAERPTWLPVTAGFNADAGSRIAGATVGPIFPFYYLVQGVCGFVALITSLGFSRQEKDRPVHRWRFFTVLAAVLTVVVGWPLSQKISDLRYQRYDPDPAIATPAKEQFGRLHTYSLLLNFGTIGLVGAALAMASSLPRQGKAAE